MAAVAQFPALLALMLVCRQGRVRLPAPPTVKFSTRVLLKVDLRSMYLDDEATTHIHLKS